ncbi:SMI1/KNR4 family protein [Streptomyces sp. PKU-EA00015]|uniref:SMI1/KNR4 family protein n=1 Tax=Streptomyces sp. PKU-EA00015 TaxID=2748326 RepID=UPI00159FF516|nr:SMI1/KNR4 family protein [Streptomyces sp. PKU-EA00015]NWF30706.1 SMI1/KNR4 family protein [Streptomyces sp. PKU-EA00015]
MTQEFDLVRSLEAAVEDRRAAWEFVRGFAADWSAEPLGAGDGWSEAELAAAEERLGLRLPAALREAYALLGRRTDLTGNHDTLRSPAELYVDEAGEALVFRDENQGAARWGILLTDLAQEDPPVRMRPDLADKSREKWEDWLARTSLAFVEIVLSESVHAPDDLVDVLDALEEEDLEELEQRSVGLPFPRYPEGEEPGTRWFLRDGVLLRDDGAWLMARGRTEEALDAVREAIPGDWLNG